MVRTCTQYQDKRLCVMHPKCDDLKNRQQALNQWRRIWLEKLEGGALERRIAELRLVIDNV